MTPEQRAALVAAEEDLMLVQRYATQAAARLRRAINTEPVATGVPGSGEIVLASTGLPPSSVSLAEAATLDLDVVWYDSGSGQVLAGLTTTWASLNTGVATVNASTGVVTGVAAGSTTITAAVNDAGGSVLISLTTDVTVSAATVASVAASVASVSGTVGGSGSIIFTPQDAGGNSLAGRTVTAASTDTNVATVSMNGYTCTVTFIGAGSCTITGTCNTVDSSAIPTTVTAATSNEPAGYTTVFTLDDLTLAEMVAAGFTGTSSSNMTFQTPAGDAMASQFTRYSTSVARARYLTSLPSGSGPFTANKTITATNGLYNDMDMGVSANWFGEESGVNKVLHFGAGSAVTIAYLSFQGAGSGAITLQLRLQGCPANVANNSSSNARNIPIGSYTRATARRVEVRMVMNTVDGSGIAQPDGLIEIWLDGVQVKNVTAAFRGKNANGTTTSVNCPNGTEQWNNIRWNGQWGGYNPGTFPPAEQYQYIGYWKVSRA